jgi:hypothetical protein
MMASPLPKVINCALSLGFYVIVVMSLISIIVELEMVIVSLCCWIYDP